MATTEAMNACLKLLEEPPSYALIFLTVKHGESLLETIRSRTINLSQPLISSLPSLELKEALE
jgi:DNA polymerase-3 subunit delta'